MYLNTIRDRDDLFSCRADLEFIIRVDELQDIDLLVGMSPEIIGIAEDSVKKFANFFNHDEPVFFHRIHAHLPLKCLTAISPLGAIRLKGKAPAHSATVISLELYSQGPAQITNSSAIIVIP